MSGEGLAALEARLAHDLACLQLPASRWTVPRRHDGAAVVDVAIVGAGMAGLALAAALVHRGVEVVLYDEAPAGMEGPWATTARMETLRSPKQLAGPALGIASLTFRAWFEAQFGLQAWTAMDKIPRLQWMQYLVWYRRVMGVEVRNDTALTGLHPLPGAKAVRLDLRAPQGESSVLARRVVLATGRDGLGGPIVPAFVNTLPRTQWAHSSDEMDYGLLKGLRVGVVGAGSSAMDSAATALEAGAYSVELLIRRPDLPRVNKGKGAGVPGLTQGHYDLPDELKWRIRHYINVVSVPPPHGSTLRVSGHTNAFFNFSCPVLSIEPRGEFMRVSTPKGNFDLDFLIVSTGFKVDWRNRPEFDGISAHIRAWKDRFAPLPGDEDQELADSPDLGPAFEFQARVPGECPGLGLIHCFCYPAALSHGTVSGDIPAISEGARRLAGGIASLFYREDFDHHYANLLAYAEPELSGDEWLPAPAPQERN